MCICSSQKKTQMGKKKREPPTSSKHSSLLNPLSNFLNNLTITPMRRLPHFLSRLTLFLALIPKRREQHHTNVEKEHHSRNNAVGDLALDRVTAELEAKSSVDGAKDEECASIPYVGVGPDGALVLSLPDGVVDESEERLEEEKGDDDDADDGVVSTDLLTSVT